jgi:hypothetical protein
LAIILTPAAITDSVKAGDAGRGVRLFNGKDLSGWMPFIWDYRAGKQDTTTPTDVVWTVTDGNLICKGRPVGYLRSEKEYRNYKLELEWRWPAGSIGGNSGVLVHASTPQTLGLWPKSIEVQLFRRNAGDFWVIGTELKVPNSEQRRSGRRYRNLTDDSEKPIGQWNKLEIVCKGDEIKVFVNGELVNHATDSSVTSGAIALQAEGAEIYFRNFVLTPL